jgi:methionyl-tRNA formyltransferase
VALRIAILRSDDAHHEYLTAALRARFDVVAVVVEPAAAQRRRLWRRRKHADWAAWTYHAWRRRLTGRDAYRRRYFALPDAGAPRNGSGALGVGWINEAPVAALLERQRPDVTVVIATSQIGARVLQAAGDVVINVHGGHLPDYRGNHCFFWALYRGDFAKIGSTLHFVDRDLDTGDIIENVTPPIVPNDTAESLYCRAEKMAIDRLVTLLEGYERGEPLARRPQSRRGRLFRTRERAPWHDVILWARRTTGSLRLPASGSAARPVERPVT